MKRVADKLSKNTKDLVDNKSFYMFLFCLAISVGFWLSSKLSKKYIYEFTYKIEYVNIPLDKIFSKDTKDKLYIKLKANGFTLLKNKFFRKKLAVNLSKVIKKEKEEYFWDPKDYTKEIAAQIGNMEIIESKSKNPIFLPLSKLASKVVPIELDLNVNYKKGFKEKKILLTPNFLKISGPIETIEKINSLKAKFSSLNKINSNIKKELNLIFPKKVKAAQKKVKFDLMVEPYTEKIIDVPIKIINFPKKYLSVKLSLDKVRLAFKVDYENYKKIKKYNFLVVCDLSKFNEGFNQLPLFLKSLPDFIDKKDVIMHPDKVRVLVLEN